MDLKEKAKNYAKNKAKKHLRKIIISIMIPWGAIAIIILFAIVGLMSFFISSDAVGLISPQQNKMIESYLEQHNNPSFKQDYLGLAQGCEPTNQIFENYFRFLVLDKKVSLPMSNQEIENLLNEAMKDLTPKFTYETGTVTTVTEKIGSNGQEIGSPTTSIQDVTLLKTSQSVYGDISYSYGYNSTTTTTTETVPATNSEQDMKNDISNNKTQEVTIKQTITSPYIKEQKVTNKFGMLEKLLASEGVSKEEMQTAIGAILFTQNTSSTGLNDSWKWLTEDKLPNPPSPQQTGGFGGGGIYGNLIGIPQYLQPFYKEAAEASGIPNWLLAGDTEQESDFNPNAVSDGGYGLMQFQYTNNGVYNGNWGYYLNLGMREFLAKAGYTGSNSSLWNQYLKDPRMQIFVGAYEMRYYMNYVLKREGKVPNYDYNSTSNMKLINWNGIPNDTSARTTVALGLACYNGGQGNYSNYSPYYIYSVKVLDYALKFRASMIMGSGAGNQKMQSVINVGRQIMADGNSRYVFGGGRNSYDQEHNIFDCSSFVWYCFYKGAGIKLGPLQSVTTWSILGMTQRVNPNNMQPGDLVFFSIPEYGNSDNDHIGIYIGNGQFINCECTGGVRIASLSNPYWSKYFNGTVSRVV
ncbi:NlpC/P60 family protein [Clostridium thermobutyricum]|uniref:C40 family peptidase n=1 Tax=Clostridium thermobutyricum TaxID=29372 RepID=UPI0018AAD3F0|nr:NlpC/P60 family protein [Clostridium thermobutyricum]